MSERKPIEPALTDGTRVLFRVVVEPNDTERYAGARWMLLPEPPEK